MKLYDQFSKSQINYLKVLVYKVTIFLQMYLKIKISL
jgi:hypothetical protein